MRQRRVLKRAMASAVVVAMVSAPIAAGAQRRPGYVAAPERTEAASPASERRAAELVARMTLDEKLQIVAGVIGVQLAEGMPKPPAASLGGDGFIQGIPRLGIPNLQIIGSGLGVTDWFFKRPNSQSTALPSTLAVASSFDPQLAYDFGIGLGRETRAQGFNMALGGGANITRDPRGGRAFEYHGEDPVLTGKLIAQTLRGTQDQGLPATIKHFAVNDIENGRYGIDIKIDERAMRESDLLAFEIAIKESGVAAVMCAYNKINGVYACENEALLTDILKKEWGYDGWVISDWGATHSTVGSAMAGMDQEFFTKQFYGAPLKAAVERGDVPVARLDDMVRRILAPFMQAGAFDRTDPVRPIDRAAGAALAQRTAEAGAVLLKNEGALPLAPGRLRSIAVIGFRADQGVLTGGGSSQVNPVGGPANAGEITPNPYANRVLIKSPPLAAIRVSATGARVSYDPGTDPLAAAEAARGADVAIVFAGRHRNEGLDVPDLTLGDGQDAMIAAVAAANPNTVVVLQTGGAVLMPWLGSVKAVLEVWFPGQRGGDAIANLLFGRVNPSGKLPLSFPASEADLPRPKLPGPPLEKRSGTSDLFNPSFSEVTYDEGALVGYKWYDARDKPVLFPFGHGLSYTRFGYADLFAKLDGAPRVTFELANQGRVAGTEIAQVYVQLPASAGAPPRRLAGWARETLAPGGKRRVSVTLERKALAVWSIARKRWVIPAGDYVVSVGASSRDIKLNRTVRVAAERTFGY